MHNADYVIKSQFAIFLNEQEPFIPRKGRHQTNNYKTKQLQKIDFRIYPMYGALLIIQIFLLSY